MTAPMEVREPTEVASFTAHAPHLIRVLETLAKRQDNFEVAQKLLAELSGITVLVAKKFTNDKTADGLLEAFYLTIGCISLALSQENIAEHQALPFLLQDGAEIVFQKGFRHIKELACMPDQYNIEGELNNVKPLFMRLCRADSNRAWSGAEDYKKDLQHRKTNKIIVDCAKWLRKNHYAGPVKSALLDCNGTIAITVIFAIVGDGRIVAHTCTREMEALILKARESELDIEKNWMALIEKIPAEYQAILRERMAVFRKTIIKKILSEIKVNTVINNISLNYAGVEMDLDL